jgi:hypothetical protein
MKLNAGKINLLHLLLVTALLSGCGGEGSKGADGTNGANGSNGAEGATGVSSLIMQNVEVAGLNCSRGGIRIDTGADANRNNVLDSNEISQTNFVCNGENGTDGASGAGGTSHLITQSIEASGLNCAQGGIRIDVGADSNGNTILDSDEISQTSFVCSGVNTADGSDGSNGTDGINYLISQTIESAGASCAAGGIRIDSGADSNRNNILDGEEITQTNFVCGGVNGSDGVDGSNGVDGTNGADGTDGTNGSDGTDGINYLITQSTEAAGANCANAGIRIDSGPDSNRNNVLDSGEISQTNYVCNGENGNSAPIAISQAQVVPKNSSGFAITLQGTDPDSDAISYSLKSLPSHGTLTGSAPNLTYIPDIDYSGDDSFSFAVDDGFYTSASVTVSLSVEQIGFSFSTLEQTADSLIAPQLLKHLANGEEYLSYPMDVVLSADDKTAYVATYNGGFRVMDVSDPAAAFTIGKDSGSHDGYAIALSPDGNTTYQASELFGLEAIDISDATAPNLLGTYNSADAAVDVVLSADGHTAYLADYGDGLLIIDISNPTAPSLLGQYNTPGQALGVALSADGGTAYVADGTSGLRILDVSDPSSITPLGSYNPSGRVQKVKISADGSKAFLAVYDDGLIILDISDASNPVVLGQYNPVEYLVDISLSADESKAYLATESGKLLVVDIEDTAAPELLASYFNGDSDHGYGVALSRDGRTAYYAADEPGLYILDVSRDYVTKSQDFGSSSIQLRIASDNPIALSMSVTADRSDIITLGDYSTTLAYADYNDGVIDIPINSLSGSAGITVLTVTLSYQGKSVTRTVYVEVM